MATTGNACTFCAGRKRRCDRKLPQCSSCFSRGLECHYPGNEPNTLTQSLLALTNGNNGTGQLTTPAIEDEFLPTVFFLDNRVFQQLHMQLPSPIRISNQILEDYVGDTASVAAAYWNAVHWHFPMISRVNFEREILHTLVDRKIDLLLLLVSMKLLMWRPGTEPFPHAPYQLARRSLHEAEISGFLSFRLLQAHILLLVFEYGHAVFPAAYLSVAACGRYGVALGVNKALKMRISSHTALDSEEARRAWWTILLMDRLIQLGNPSQMLCTYDPAPSDFLPADDSAYASGMVPEDLFQAGSPASVKMSMFVRLCQATYLLGRVLHFHYRASEDDESFRQSQRIQLDKTLRALLSLVYQEGALMRTHICVQSSVAYSALIILHDPKDVRNDWDHIEIMMNYLRPTAHEMSAASGAWFGNRFVGIADASPFLVFWPYHVITILHRLRWEHNEESERMMAMMQEKLRIMSGRWLLGEAYAKIYRAIVTTAMPRSFSHI